MKVTKLLLISILISLTACTLADVKVEVVSERTALENQVLGTYNSLDREMLLVASVRGVDSEGRIVKPLPHSQEHKDAMSAMQIQAFHSDDLNAFKQLGWVGENNDGLLTAFPFNKDQIPENLKSFAERYQSEEFNSVVAQLNQAREVMMNRVIEMNDNLSEADMPAIRKIFSKYNAERALKGEKIQMPDGTWGVK